jgi:hypothetical protein
MHPTSPRVRRFRVHLTTMDRTTTARVIADAKVLRAAALERNRLTMVAVGLDQLPLEERAAAIARDVFASQSTAWLQVMRQTPPAVKLARAFEMFALAHAFQVSRARREGVPEHALQAHVATIMLSSNEW